MGSIIPEALLLLKCRAAILGTGQFSLVPVVSHVGLMCFRLLSCAAMQEFSFFPLCRMCMVCVSLLSCAAMENFLGADLSPTCFPLLFLPALGIVLKNVFYLCNHSLSIVFCFCFCAVLGTDEVHLPTACPISLPHMSSLCFHLPSPCL